MTMLLLPKPQRRMKEPRKDTIRWERDLARAELALERTPWWWPTFHRLFARVVETDKQTAAEQAALERV